MLTKKDFEQMQNGAVVKTVALVKSYAKRPTKNGSFYMDGTVEMKGTIPFKVWSGSLFDDLEKYEYQGTICNIVGTVNEYNGRKDIIITDMKALEDGAYNESDFFEDKYNIPSYVNALNDFVEKRCTTEGIEIYHTVMDGIMDRFKVEFAARGHHDAFKGGLLAHTYKVTIILRRVITLYSHLLSKTDEDLLYLGAIFHDIGKIHEYTNGTIVGNGLLVSHHTFGVEMLVAHKEKIVELKGEEFFYRLLAIIEQHHGEYEETPRALEAYIIHTADMMESTLEAMDEQAEKDVSPIMAGTFKLN